MNKLRNIAVIGGGTFQPIRNHLALAAPAFGTTATKISDYLEFKTNRSRLYLTKMAYPQSKLITNEDVEALIDDLLLDDRLGTIILNVAFCDYKAKPIDGIENDWHGERLQTADGDLTIELTPTEKIIKKIRIKRPDIFLVGFKTTTNKTPAQQFLLGLKMMKSVKCNLVLANDTVTRNNMILTAEETIYGETTDRDAVLKELVEMTLMRCDLTYNPSNFIESQSASIKNTPRPFQDAIQFLIDNGGFIENNSNGFTPGHFCGRNGQKSFLSSQRKANHNLVFTEGMSQVSVSLDEKFNDVFTVYGKRKASVGARSQWMILQKFPEYDCIIHTHNPLKEGSTIPITPQKPFQCGSLECGINTVDHMGDFGNIKAVYLDKHGANILFKSTDDVSGIINFIKENIELGIKVK